MLQMLEYTRDYVVRYVHVPYSTEITPTLIACYKAATGGMGLKIVAEDGKIHASITFITLSNYT